jgi:hypothetical protein
MPDAVNDRLQSILGAVAEQQAMSSHETQSAMTLTAEFSKICYASAGYHS